MSEAVIASIDTGADIGATATDTGAGGESGAGADQAALPANAGAGAEGQRTQATGTAADGTGADAKSAPGDATQGDGKDKLVPLAALHESRNEVRELRAKIATLEALPRLTEAQQKALDKLNTQEQAAVEKDPDFLEDPKGYVDTKLTQTQKALKELKDADAQRVQQEGEQREVTQVMSAISTKEQEFVKATPDYYDAVNHVRAIRASQLQLLYPRATPAQITQAIGKEEIGAARQWLQDGVDPADFAYKYAKAMGYAPKAPAVTPPAVKETKVDKEAARSLGGGGGADSTDDSEENAMPEFNAAITERFNRGKRK